MRLGEWWNDVPTLQVDRSIDARRPVLRKNSIDAVHRAIDEASAVEPLTVEKRDCAGCGMRDGGCEFGRLSAGRDAKTQRKRATCQGNCGGHLSRVKVGESGGKWSSY
jgi:hypothetical protein